MSRAPHWSAALTQLGACSDAVSWARRQPTPEAAWAACTRFDWMLWLVERTDEDPRHAALRLLACDFAAAALQYVPAGEDRPARAIETARAWCRSEATDAELAAASGAAWAAWAAASPAAYAAAASAGRAAQAGQLDTLRQRIPMPELLRAEIGRAHV